MSDRSPARVLSFVLVLLLVAASPSARADDDFFAEPSWQPVAEGDVIARLLEHLDQIGIAPDRVAAVRDSWWSLAAEPGAADDLLDRLALSLAKVDERVAELVAHCTGFSRPGHEPEFDWLADSATPLLVRHNMRLYFARWLVQEGFYDEALEWTDGLATHDVVAPDALLFYRAVAYHRLVEPDKADAALGRLLERQDELPTRYQKLAALMQQDLVGLEDDSLDHIARRMEDIRRRLGQGSAGERVQEIENGVIASLDKLIEQIEDQLQQQQGQAGGAAGGQPSGSPMQDSQIAELKGPGQVEQRNIGDRSGWGNMPDKDRERALQEIGREFPSHYREVIEEYFRRLAAEEQ